MDRAQGLAYKGMTRLAVATLLGLLGLVHLTYAAEFACAAGDVACLIAAIHTANGNGDTNTITLAAGAYTLTAAENDTDGPTGLPSIASALTLQGAGVQSTVLERAAGAPPFRLLHVAATGALTLQGLTLQGGALTDLPGGGIYTRGTLTLTGSTLRGNMASEGGGIYHSEGGAPLTITNSTLRGNVAIAGGGIGAYASLTLTNSTVSDNVADGSGGGIGAYSGTLTLTNSTVSGNVSNGYGGGIAGFAVLTLTNSTVSGNGANDSGGGINHGITTLTLTNSTLSGNVARQGGGINISGGGVVGLPPGHAILENTILAQNTVPPTGTGPDCATSSGTSPGQATSQGHNLIGDPTGCGITLAASDLTGDPGVGAYTDTGVPGQGYVPLRPTSPAIDAADTDVCPPTDQLGQPRVGPCDIGAVEFQPETVTIRQAVFADQLARLFVSAISSAPPDAALVAMVPGCLANAPMHRLESRYVLLQHVEACGDLNGQTVTVISTYGGSASAPLR